MKEYIKIYIEDEEIKIQGSVDLGYIGLFKDSQIEILDSLEEIREWDIVEENLDEGCPDEAVIDFLNKYFNDFFQKIEKNIDNINGTFLLQVFVDMDCCENDFMVIDGLFDEKNLFTGMRKILPRYIIMQETA